MKTLNWVFVGLTPSMSKMYIKKLDTNIDRINERQLIMNVNAKSLILIDDHGIKSKYNNQQTTFKSWSNEI